MGMALFLLKFVLRHARQLIQETTVTLGDLIATLHDYFMDLYDDEDIATMATAATINDMMCRPLVDQELAA